MVLEKNSKRFGSEAQQTVEQSVLEEDLDYSGKRMTVDLENQDTLGISKQEREGCTAWSCQGLVIKSLMTKTKD